MTYFYSDMKNGLPISETGNVEILYDDDVVIQSIRNLVSTVTGERVRNPIGSKIIRLLFESITDDTAELLSDSLVDLIETYEPRVELLNINVEPDTDSNVYQITLSMRILPYGRTLKYTTRLRSLAGN